MWYHITLLIGIALLLYGVLAIFASGMSSAGNTSANSNNGCTLSLVGIVLIIVSVASWF